MSGRLGELLHPTKGDGFARECTRIRAKYRPGESLRATYRVGNGTSSLLVSGRMFPAGAAAGQFARARAAAADQGGDNGSVLLDEETSTVFWVFPQDRKLRGLDQLTRPPAELRMVFGRPWVHSELMAYTPEKAATVRCADETGQAVGFAKVQAEDEGQRSVDTLRAAGQGITDHGALILPRAVDYLPERHMALFTVAPGRPLNQLDRAAVPQAMEALGAALSVLHNQPTRGFAPFTRLEPDRVVDAGRLVGTARPDLAALCGDLVESLLGQSAAVPADRIAARRPASQERAGPRGRGQPGRPRPGRDWSGGRGARCHVGAALVPAARGCDRRRHRRRGGGGAAHQLRAAARAQ
jgi:hypothetical protein